MMNDDAERDQHLAEHIAGQLAQDEPFEQPAEQRDARARRPAPRATGSEHAASDAHAEIGAEHEERAVREVGDPHQPEDEREPGRQEEQQSAQRQAVRASGSAQVLHDSTAARQASSVGGKSRE